MARPEQVRVPPSELFAIEPPPSGMMAIFNPRTWLYIVQEHPFMVLGAVWLGTAVAAIVAIAGLMSPGEPMNQTASQSSSEQAAAAAAVETEASPMLPLWTVGALVGGCAAGSFVVSRLVSRSPQSKRVKQKRDGQRQRPKQPGLAPGAIASRPSLPPALRKAKSKSTLKKLKPYQEDVEPATLLEPLPQSLQPKPLSLPQPQSFSPAAQTVPNQTPPASQTLPPQLPRAQAQPVNQVQPVPQAQPQFSSRQSVRSQRRIAMPQPHAAQPQVTVVPAETAHPLDWSEDSLAHSLDIRKQVPLSALM